MKKVFLAEVNVDELQEELTEKNIKINVQSIVESYIDCIEGDKKEVMVFTSFSKVPKKGSQSKQMMTKKAYVLRENSLEKVSKHKVIDHTEFYERLIGNDRHFISHRIRLRFKMNDTQYSFDFDNENKYCIIEVFSVNKESEVSQNDILSSLNSAIRIEKEYSNIETAVYFTNALITA